MEGVVTGKCKDAVQPLDEIRAVFDAAGKNYLGVAGGGEGVSQGLQLLSQLLRVIKLAVIGNGKCTASDLLFHGLVAGYQVYD